MPDCSVAYDGESVFIEYAWRGDGTLPAKVYFDGLDPRDQICIARIWNYIDQNPEWRHPHKFKAVKGESGLWELKSRQARIFAVWLEKQEGERRKLLLLSGLTS